MCQLKLEIYKINEIMWSLTSWLMPFFTSSLSLLSRTNELPNFSAYLVINNFHSIRLGVYVEGTYSWIYITVLLHAFYILSGGNSEQCICEHSLSWKDPNPSFFPYLTLNTHIYCDLSKAVCFVISWLRTVHLSIGEAGQTVV